MSINQEQRELQIDILHESLRLLRIHQLWPSKGKELKPGWTFYTRVILMLISASGLFMGSLLHLIHTLKYKVNVDYSEDLAMVFSLLGCTYMDLLFSFQCAKLATLCHDLSTFEEYPRPTNLAARNKQLSFLSWAYYWFCTNGIILYAIFSYLAKKTCEKNNKENDLSEVCGLLVAVWLPFDFNYFPAREIVFALQIYGGMMMNRSGGVVCFSVLELSEHIILRINQLKDLLVDTFNNRNYDDVVRMEKMRYCLKFHQHIISLTDRLGDSYKDIMFVHVVITGVTHGCLMNQISRGPAPGPIMHLLGWMGALIVVCIGGQRLIDESNSLADVFSELKWYNCNKEIRKLLLILIARTQKPLTIPAGPLGTLSFELYLAIMQTAYSYLTMLRQKISTE